MKRRVLFPILAGSLLLAACSDGLLPTASFAPQFSSGTSNGGVQPGFIPGSFADADWLEGGPFCAVIDPTWLQGSRVEDPVTGLVEHGFTFTTNGTLLAWSSLGHVMRAVLVVGTDSHIYYYDGPVTWSADAGLHAPGSPTPPIQYYTYCYTEGTLPPDDPTDPVEPGEQGCGAGYWRNTQAEWPAYAEAVLGDVFGNLPAALGGVSFRDALALGGGRGVDGALRLLSRAAVAALLNASSDDVAYPRTAQSVIDAVQAAIDSGDRAAILELAEALDADNDLGCPIDADGRVIE
jgi:hypothetical protein